MSSAPSGGQTSERVGPFQFSILVLSVLALAAIAADTFLALPREVSRILQVVDLVACAVFFADFVVRFHAASAKLAFMKWGWIDLLASVPTIEALRLGRFVAVLRVLRLLRGIRSLRALLQVLFVSRQRGGVVSVVMMTFLITVFSSVAILFCERVPEANIKTAGDAIWWSATTITTVGYGDRFPVTTAGRVVAMFLMCSGVGLFGALSGIVASLFLGRDKEEDSMVAELKLLRAELAHSRQCGASSSQPPGASP